MRALGGRNAPLANRSIYLKLLVSCTRALATHSALGWRGTCGRMVLSANPEIAMHVISYSYASGQTFQLQVADTATAAQQTAAIQKALTAVAGHGGGTVSLSADTWTLQGTGKAADGCLKIGSSTTLEGAGMGATILKLADGSTATTGILRTDSGKLLPDGSYSTAHDITVSGLTIDGNTAHTTGNVDGFYCGPKPDTAQADTNIGLDHVEIMNCSRYGFDPHEQTVGLTIANCVSHDNGADGFTLDFCSNVTLTNNLAYGNGRYGFNLVTGTHDVTMTNNDAHDNGASGISVQTGDNEIRAWTDSIHITGGTLSQNGRAGIEIKEASHIDISHVVISDNATDGIRLAGVDAISIDGNVYSNNGGNGHVSIAGYLQDFGDSDPLNDVWIPTHNVMIDGVLQPDPAIPSNTALWTYHVTAGDDVITGSAGADTIAAGSGNDTVAGGAGNDVLLGNDGNDTLNGGDGSDKVYGNAGDDRLMFSTGYDTLDGGAGSDTVDFAKAAAAVTVDLSAAAVHATIGGAAVADLVSIENLKGSSFADVLTGSAAANVIDGGGGGDVIDGGDGNDTLIGNGGNDRIVGGLGINTLTGGTGSDVFAFGANWGSDTITDFTHKQDKIEIASMTGVTSFGQLAITQIGADTHVTANGHDIVLAGVAANTMTAADFLFV